jgi:hypothetical protein
MRLMCYTAIKTIAKFMSSKAKALATFVAFLVFSVSTGRAQQAQLSPSEAYLTAKEAIPVAETFLDFSTDIANMQQGTGAVEAIGRLGNLASALKGVGLVFGLMDFAASLLSTFDKPASDLDIILTRLGSVEKQISGIDASLRSQFGMQQKFFLYYGASQDLTRALEALYPRYESWRVYIGQLNAKGTATPPKTSMSRDDFFVQVAQVGYLCDHRRQGILDRTVEQSNGNYYEVAKVGAVIVDALQKSETYGTWLTFNEIYISRLISDLGAPTSTTIDTLRQVESSYSEAQLRPIRKQAQVETNAYVGPRMAVIWNACTKKLDRLKSLGSPGGISQQANSFMQKLIFESDGATLTPTAVNELVKKRDPTFFGETMEATYPGTSWVFIRLEESQFFSKPFVYTGSACTWTGKPWSDSNIIWNNVPAVRIDVKSGQVSQGTDPTCPKHIKLIGYFFMDQRATEKTAKSPEYAETRIKMRNLSAQHEVMLGNSEARKKFLLRTYEEALPGWQGGNTFFAVTTDSFATLDWDRTFGNAWSQGVQWPDNGASKASIYPSKRPNDVDWDVQGRAFFFNTPY